MESFPVTSWLWYLRSLSDRDTHHGELRPDGTVTAACGISFRPLCLLRGTGPALSGSPPDPDQVCPACKRASSKRLLRDTQMSVRATSFCQWAATH